MTILDKITQTASNYPDRTAYHTFCPDDLKSGGGRKQSELETT